MGCCSTELGSKFVRKLDELDDNDIKIEIKRIKI